MGFPTRTVNVTVTPADNSPFDFPPIDEPKRGGNEELYELYQQVKNSRLEVSLLGNRYLVEDQTGKRVKIDAVANRLLEMSRLPKNTSDVSNGVNCVDKLRNFYEQPTGNILAGIRDIFDLFGSAVRLLGFSNEPYPISRVILSSREEYTMGPERIKGNFYSTNLRVDYRW